MLELMSFLTLSVNFIMLPRLGTVEVFNGRYRHSEFGEEEEISKVRLNTKLSSVTDHRTFLICINRQNITANLMPTWNLGYYT